MNPKLDIEGKIIIQLKEDSPESDEKVWSIKPQRIVQNAQKLPIWHAFDIHSRFDLLHISLSKILNKLKTKLLKIRKQQSKLTNVLEINNENLLIDNLICPIKVYIMYFFYP